MFRAIFCPSSGAWDWDSYSTWYCLTVHHQLGKVIQMNQLHATMIYWSIRSAQHVSGNILPIIRSVSLRYLQHMVSCCCGGQGVGERQRGTVCHAVGYVLRFAGCCSILQTGHITFSSTTDQQLENTARNTTGSNHCIILVSSWWWA